MRTVIGVMGGGLADEATLELARELGRLIALEDWVLLNGGRDSGVMAASAAGARDAGGLVVGVLPDSDTRRASTDLDIPIITGMGDARNVINVLSSRVVIAMAGGAGTVSEVAHALKLGRPVIILGLDLDALFAAERASGHLLEASTAEMAVDLTRRLLAEESRR